MTEHKGLRTHGLTKEEVAEHLRRFKAKTYVGKLDVPLSPKAISKLRGLDTPK